MCAAATPLMTPQRITSEQNLQLFEFYQSQPKNNNNNSSKYYYDGRFFYDTTDQQARLLTNDCTYSTVNASCGDIYTSLPTEDTLLLNNSSSATFSNTLHKSNSYHGTVQPKSTIIKQDSVNGRIATSLTDNTNNFCVTIDGNANSTAADGTEEHDALLIDVTSGAAGVVGSESSNKSLRRHSRSKSRNIYCCRTYAFLNRSWYLSYLLPISILLALIIVGYFTRDYAKRLLYWIETQNPWMIFGIFIALFTLVSFPIVVGYFVLMITSGYLFGVLKGLLTVILGANLGVAIAHATMRSFRHRIPLHRIIKNETGRAILRVISGPRAFKVVLFTRLTPIPFGIQNAIFGVSTIKPRVYHTATFLGLLPAQTINVYLGSTLRSMHEVINTNGKTAVTGYITFAVEVVCGVGLMFWVIQKARKELSDTLLTDISNEGKLIDIQV